MAGLRRRRSVVIAVAAAVLVPLLVVMVLFDPYRMSSDRMQPTLHAGDRVLARPTTGADVDVGDVVVVRPDGSDALITRVAAIEGAELDLPDGETVQVPAGHVWVLSDDRETGIDSRQLGAIPHDHVVGRVVLRWWPPSAFGGV